MILVSITVLLCIVGVYFYLIWYKTKLLDKINELQKQVDELKEKELSKKDLQFLEFTVDMYIKYAKDLDIHSPDQHEYIVEQLELIRKKYLTI
jgi:hypothetical protein